MNFLYDFIILKTRTNGYIMSNEFCKRTVLFGIIRHFYSIWWFGNQVIRKMMTEINLDIRNEIIPINVKHAIIWMHQWLLQYSKEKEN